MPGFGINRTTAKIALLCAATGVVAACGGEDEDRKLPRSPSGSAGPTGGSAGAGGAGTGGAGAGGGGGAAPSTCGNDAVDPGEACDGSDLQDQTCVSLGFNGGELRCSADCTAVDTSGCTGVEVCQDGQDNDGDLSVDCDDPDCAAACAAMCAAPVSLADPARVAGSTLGHALVESECTLGSPGVAYTFTATTTGFLDVILSSRDGEKLIALLRTNCDDTTELACGGVTQGAGVETRLTVPAQAGDSVHVIVTGADESQAGAFDLSVRSRQTSCGDRIQDPTEECDNELGRENDGCSDDCRLEATEAEPNNDVASANEHTVPFYAAISPEGDVDVIRVSVPRGPTVLIAETADVTSSDCIGNRLDSTIDILDERGVVLTSAIRGGAGLCARAVAPSLPAGDYYVQVRADEAAALPTFPYRLDVTLIEEVCGDGRKTAGEQCDDGNTAAGDGCSPTCRFELIETEDNGTRAQADVYTAPWLAEIAPAGDVDWVSVNVPGPSSTLYIVIGDNGTGTCMSGQLDSYIELLDETGATVLASDEDSGLGYCSSLSVSDLAGGTYYVKVRAADIVPDATFFYRMNVTIL